MRWSVNLGRLFGIRVELHVTFLLFVGWIAVNQGLLTGDVRRAAAAVALLLLVFGCVVLHELGHALMARRFGIATRDIVLLPIGGVARLERMPEKPGQEMLVAIAGPLVNVLIAALLVLVMSLSGGPADLARFGGGLIESLLVVNVLMLSFNLIPAFPMDGGRVLRALLALRLPYVRATRIASAVGQGVALLLGVAGLFYFNQWMLPFVALFIFLAAGEERALVQTRASLDGLPVRAAMLTDFRHLEAHEPLRRAVEHLMTGSQQDFPVLEDGALRGVLTRAGLVAALQRHGLDVPVGEVMSPSPCSADTDEPLEGVVARMRGRDCPVVCVLERGRLVGLVTLDNVGDLLQVREALRKYASGG
jgi:Zn-dependent protease/predicted transcriptional regulator